jgi:uncharacterized phage-associated protein
MSINLTTEQIDKIGNAVIFLSHKVGEFNKTKLLKSLFLLEEWSIKKFGTPFFNLDFKLWKFGPVVEPIYRETTSGEIAIFKDYFKKNQFDEFEAVSEFDDSEFSDNDIALLYEVVDFARHKNAIDFVRVTHAPDSLWTKSAKKYGVYEDLEHERFSVTDFSIDFSMLFEHEPDTSLFDKYSSYIEYKEFTDHLKHLKSA